VMLRSVVRPSVRTVLLGLSLLGTLGGCGGRNSLSGPPGDDDSFAASGGVNNASGGTSGVSGNGPPGAGGGHAAGGSVGTGGSVAAGGSIGTGGGIAAGGSVAAGGSIGNGGTIGVGGSVATGGSSATGGSVSSGGSIASGGTLATGGVAGSAGSAATNGSGGDTVTVTGGAAGVGTGGSAAQGTGGSATGGSSSGGSSTGGTGAGGSSGASGTSGASGSGGSTGTLGNACSVNAALACQGAAQRLRLLCDGGVWKNNGTCLQTEACDQRTGVCAPIVPACDGLAPGQLYCTMNELDVCGPDLVTTTEMAICGGLCVASASSAVCMNPTCGDGRVENDEQCDDGNTVDEDACTNACHNAFCGDGSLWSGHEKCDDGNNAPHDGCSPVCGADVASVSAGLYNTCALGVNGIVQCWGYNASGQLGDGDTSTRGYSSQDMGVNLPIAQLGTGMTATALASGDTASCAILTDGSIKCWGQNSYGGLGVGDSAPRGNGQNQMGDHLPAVPLGSGRTALAVAVGSYHACAVLDDHSVKCWGYNASGQLGIGDTQARGDVPNELGDALPAVNLGTGRTAVAVAAGNLHSCALLDDGSVKCWGYNGYGAIGTGDGSSRGDGIGAMGDDLPAVKLGTGRTAKAITAGEYHTCALLDDSSVKCWGYNGYGQLGQGDTASRGYSSSDLGDTLKPIDLGTGRTATRVVAGYYSTCVVLDNGGVKCWGYNAQGGLGVGDTASRGDGVNEMGNYLVQVNLGTSRTATNIAVGQSHTCAVLDNSTIKCWGGDNYGQLGVGSSQSYGSGANQLGDNLPYVIVTF